MTWSDFFRKRHGHRNVWASGVQRQRALLGPLKYGMLCFILLRKLLLSTQKQDLWINTCTSGMISWFSIQAKDQCGEIWTLLYSWIDYLGWPNILVAYNSDPGSCYIMGVSPPYLQQNPGILIGFHVRIFRGSMSYTPNLPDISQIFQVRWWWLEFLTTSGTLTRGTFFKVGK